MKPSDDASAAVHEWLEEYGIGSEQLSYSDAKDWISVRLPLSTVEDMLNTEYSVWEHQDGSNVVRTEGYSLPQYVHEHISTIQPTNSWARLEGAKTRTELKKRSLVQKRESHAIVVDDSWDPSASTPPLDNSTVYAACNFTHVTPDCLRTLYGTINYTVQAAGVNKMAHTNYLEEATNRSDIHQFLELYRPEAAPYAYEFEAVSIAGAILDNGTNVADEGLDVEANLDAEYMIGIGYPTPLVAYHTGGRNPSFVPDLVTTDNSDEPFLVWANYMLGLSDAEIPKVISSSYGDDEQTVSRAYAQAVCNQFAQLGARGVSLFFSSGDSGVGSDGECISNLDNSTVEFLPSFPPDCPYVTVVGATRNYPEVAALRKLRSGAYFTSGAGFANYFDMPAYQKNTVNTYVKSLGGLYDGLYNKSGKFSYPTTCEKSSFLTKARSCVSRHCSNWTIVPCHLERVHGERGWHIWLLAHRCSCFRPSERCVSGRRSSPGWLPQPMAVQVGTYAVHRRGRWIERGLQHDWLPCGSWMGCGDWLGNSVPTQAAGCLWFGSKVARLVAPSLRRRQPPFSVQSNLSWEGQRMW